MQIKNESLTAPTPSGAASPRDAVASLLARTARLLHRLANEGVDIDASLTGDLENYAKVLPHFDNHHNAGLCPYCNAGSYTALLAARRGEETLASQLHDMRDARSALRESAEGEIKVLVTTLLATRPYLYHRSSPPCTSYREVRPREKCSCGLDAILAQIAALAATPERDTATATQEGT